MSDKSIPHLAIERGDLVYTIQPALIGSGSASRIVECIVLADLFPVDPGRTVNEAHGDVLWFPATPRRRITYSPEFESKDYGPYFGWEDVVGVTDYQGVVPTLFALKTCGAAWYRTFEEGKAALFTVMLRLAETEIDRLTDLVTEMGEEAEMVADVARAV